MAARTAMLLQLLLLLVCSCLSVEAAGAIRTCSGSACLEYTQRFTTVFSSYNLPSVGYEYNSSLFRFFMVVVFLSVGVWLLRWYMDYRNMSDLWRGVRDNTVMRIAPDWAAQRNAITRDVLAQWMARAEQVQQTIKPTVVSQLRVLAHAPMASTKLHLAPGSIGLTSPSGGGGANSPVSPGMSPLSPPPGTEYLLKLPLTTAAGHGAVVEVYFGVEMKLLLQLLQDYDRFKTRHAEAAAKAERKAARQAKKAARSGQRGAVAAIEMTNRADNEVMLSPSAASPAAARGSPNPNVVQNQAFMTPSRPVPRSIVGVAPPPEEDRPHQRSSFGSSRSNKRVTPAPLDMDLARGRAGGSAGGAAGGAAAAAVGGADGAMLPGTAPSPQNSPSHVTADGESRARLSQLSLRQASSPGPSARDTHSSPRSGLTLPRGALDASPMSIGARGLGAPLPPMLPLSPASAPLPASSVSSSSASPPPPPPPSSLPPKGGLAPFLGSMSANEASQLFRDKEYLHALPASLFGPSNQSAAQVVFPAALLTAALKDPARCPIVVLLTGVRAQVAKSLAQGMLRGPLSPAMLVDPANAAAGSAGGRGYAGGGGGGALLGGDRPDALIDAANTTAAPPGEELMTELMIVQFAPPPSQSAAAAAAAKAAQALPPPAVAAAAAAEEAEAKEAGDDTKEDEVEGAEGVASPSAAASAVAAEVVSPVNPALQDSVTSRVRFERSVVVGSSSGLFEMDDVYGLETAEGEAECIICLTDLREIVLLPCKHACVCAGCKKAISKCPICRSRIGSYLRFTPKDEQDYLDATIPKLE